MISIAQGSVDLGGYLAELTRLNGEAVCLNPKMIEDDIHKVEVYSKEKSVNSNDARNMKKIIKYLNVLLNAVNPINHQFVLSWEVNNKRTVSESVGLLHFPDYKVQTTDYIELGDKSLIRMDYRDVLEIIAFDMMYRDLGYSFQDMEEALKDVGIVAITPAARLLGLLDESPVSLSKHLRIGDSPYATCDGKMAWDYFGLAEQDGSSAFSSGRYIDCVGYSLDVALSIINMHILKTLHSANITVGLCAINENGIYYLADKLSSQKVADTADSVVVRAFGRRFEVIPKVEIF